MRSQKDASDSLWASNSCFRRCCWIRSEIQLLTKSKQGPLFFYHIIHAHNSRYTYYVQWPRDKLSIDSCLLFGNKSYISVLMLLYSRLMDHIYHNLDVKDFLLQTNNNILKKNYIHKTIDFTKNIVSIQNNI